MSEQKLRDVTVDRIHDLTDRLQQRLAEAERVRARCARAFETNKWPELHGVIARLLNQQELRKR